MGPLSARPGASFRNAREDLPLKAPKEEFMPNISEARILIIATHGYEDSELIEPRRILSERGANVTLASLEKGEIEGDNG
ncbi:MAG TPA: DJ-1/PfpI family protein, partial [Allosphingosinicella sp.]|nr:DJ-1/PfpI family protein [Allosphingosinicella sp.]